MYDRKPLYQREPVEPAFWLVEDQDGASISKPCTRAMAEDIQTWLTDFHKRRGEYTYTICRATRNTVLTTRSFEDWCDDVVYTYLMHTHTLLVTGDYPELLFDLWARGLLPDEAAVWIANERPDPE